MLFFILLLLGFLAGFLGTVVMTLVQLLEIFLTGRKTSFTPVLGLAKILRFDINRLSDKSKNILNYAVHFAYGTFWGFPLALVIFLGSPPYLSVLLVYFVIVWVQSFFVLPILSLAPPVWKWRTKSILTDGFFHFVYALSTTFFFRYLLYLSVVFSLL